jgi:hypothetical protein
MSKLISVNDDYFSAIDTEEKAYWLGFIAADGCVTESKYGPSLQVTLAEIDHGHLEKLKQAVGYQGTLYKRISSRHGSKHREATLRIGSHAFTQHLVNLGVTPRKSFTLEPWHGPQELMHHYWRGLLDGNGCICAASKGSWTVSLCSTGPVTTVMRQFMVSRGVVGGTLTPMKASAGLFQLQYQGCALPQSVARILYNDSSVYLERKYQLFSTLSDIDPAEHARLVTHDLTPARVESLYAAHGSMNVVADVLGMNRKTLWTYCGRQGIRARDLPASAHHSPAVVARVGI